MKCDKETWHLAVSTSMSCFWETRLSTSDITPFEHSTEGRDFSVPSFAASMAELFGTVLRVSLFLLAIGCISAKR